MNCPLERASVDRQGESLRTPEGRVVTMLQLCVSCRYNVSHREAGGYIARENIQQQGSEQSGSEQ